MSTTVGIYLVSFFSFTFSAGLGVLVLRECEEVGFFMAGSALAANDYFGLEAATGVLCLLSEEMY